MKKNKQSHMMNMMSTMMKNMKASNMESGQSPMDMCRKMMTDASQKGQVPDYATEELADLFKDWLAHLEEEVSAFMNNEKAADENSVAEAFNISVESSRHLIKRIKAHETSHENSTHTEEPSLRAHRR